MHVVAEIEPVNRLGGGPILVDGSELLQVSWQLIKLA